MCTTVCVCEGLERGSDFALCALCVCVLTLYCTVCVCEGHGGGF